MSLFLVTIISFACTCSLNIHYWKIQEISPPTISTLFQYSYGEFIAKQNDSIFIIGGNPTDTLLIEFNTISNSFISHSNTDNFGVQMGQSSCQIGDELYMLSANNWNIQKLNLNTLQNEHITIFPGNAYYGRCMISFNSYLIVIGGHGDYYSDSMYIYDIIRDQWLNGTSLPSPRELHSCNIINQTIYVFGGVIYINQYFDDIWMLQIDDINNCCSTEWTQLTAKLSSSKDAHRSIVVESNIYIIGGYNGSSELSDIEKFNTETKEISVYSNMIYKKDSHSAIEHNSIIYVFAGNPTSTNKYYQYNCLSGNCRSHSSNTNVFLTIWITVIIVFTFCIICCFFYYVYKKVKSKNHALIANVFGDEGQGNATALL